MILTVHRCSLIRLLVHCQNGDAEGASVPATHLVSLLGLSAGLSEFLANSVLRPARCANVCALIDQLWQSPSLLFRRSPEQHNIYFVIMSNIFAPKMGDVTVRLSEVYDLKGSSVHRRVLKPGMLSSESQVTLKDLDLTRAIRIGSYWMYFNYLSCISGNRCIFAQSSP